MEKFKIKPSPWYWNYIIIYVFLVPIGHIGYKNAVFNKIDKLISFAHFI